jgi:hypothetical protein
MTDKEQNILKRKQIKAEQFAPKPYALYAIDEFISSFPSHKSAKKERYFKQKEANQDMLDISYTVKPYKF